MSKYHNKPMKIGDLRFASQAEAKRWNELSLLVLGKQITGLRCQPRFPMVVNGKTVCTYVGDFLYLELATGRQICEDVKGMETPVFKIKRKLFEALHPSIELRVIGKPASKRSAGRRRVRLAAAVISSMPL